MSTIAPPEEQKLTGTENAALPEGFSAPAPDSSLPPWFQEEQQQAWHEFLETPAPSRKDEHWRFSNVNALSLDAFSVRPFDGDAEAVIAQSVPIHANAHRLVFCNGQLLHGGEIMDASGIRVQPLASALGSDPSFVRKFFMSQPVELGSHKFACLHKAHVNGGVVVSVPDNAALETPVEIFYWVDGANSAVFPHTLVVCGRNSKATVIDHFRSLDGAPAFCAAVNDLHVNDGGNLRYFAVQDWSPETLAFHINSTIVAANARSTALSLHLGGAFVRGESLSRMTGEGASSIMLSANPAEGARMLDQRTLQCHDAPGAYSDLLYHNTLDDKSRTVFSGLIRVAEGAHRTDAYQKVRNLILSDEAEANSMPGLEILADDVRCSHGATSGEISEEELFYMEARGIPAAVGRRMIVMGFFDSLLARIEEESIRSALSDQLRRHLRLPS